MFNIFIANLINIFHKFIIFNILIIPFQNNINLLKFHIILSFCLMIHWNSNNDKCILTMIENKLRNSLSAEGRLLRTRNTKDETFTYSYISPICNITKTNYDKFVWYVTIILTIISLYKLYKFKIII